MTTGSLIVVGIGIQLIGHLTLAAQGWIKQADKVLFAVADPAAAKWLQTLNPSAEALPYTTTHRYRRTTYREIADRIMIEVRKGGVVCAVFYGHPGVFALPGQLALQQAAAEGFTTQMLPGISAEDCLFADLLLDPARHGCQSFEATDFLIRRRVFDPHAALVLWQIALIGNLGFYQEGGHLRGLAVLCEELIAIYGPAHEVVIYEAAVYPMFPARLERVALDQLASAAVSTISTLYVPPKAEAPIDPVMAARLGLDLPMVNALAAQQAS